MQKIQILFTLLIIPFLINAQQDNLEQYFKRKHQIESRSMVALGTWSVSNLAIGTYQAISLAEGHDKYFNRMNATWNAVNLPIAIWGFVRASKNNKMPESLGKMKKQQRGLEIALLVNGGLDLGYIAAGIWMNQKYASTKEPDMVRGFGNAILMQGTYLLITDIVQYTLHRINRKKHWSDYSNVGLSDDF